MTAMKRKQKCKAVVVITWCIVMLLLMSGCGDKTYPLFGISSETYSFESGLLLLSDDTTAVMPDTESDETEPLETDAVDTVPDETDAVRTNAIDSDAEGTVYWVKNGKVWHTSKNCSSLSRSKDIISGTTDQALNNGKERACKKCEG